MAPSYKVAVYQMNPIPMQPKENYDKAASFIRDAAQQGAQLAVLPEYHLLGWVPDDPGYKAACAEWEKYLSAYLALAKDHDINIIPGTIIELHDAGTETERLLNVAYFITNEGEIAGRYVKKNLWGPIERNYLQSSARDVHPVFDTPLGKVGILICWDLGFPEGFRELISQGAKLIVIPAFWLLTDASEAGRDINPVAEQVFLDSVLTARCFENTCAIVFANVGGPQGQGYAGLSQICLPFAGPIARLGSLEGIIVADIDMHTVEEAEKCYQVRADLARADWHYDYRHDKSSNP
ncbi:hypothetical protein S40285_08661 [Stachybotrys chlorohalonatus IBT 40285]|uniref:CN hydrolase domain-containing protein n=1 Tax=Stachybotrys chlorohalonatus (strain IBT 40285) TaxID=1283841 RepID=A0A084R0D5_STAC4|nr:hypothetical protein S40285_08661 [Stachybotrys chlorohalonata IBT 40285]